MAALDWEKIDLSALVDGEELWDLVNTAQKQVQEMAHTVSSLDSSRKIT